jgi:flagellin-like hook-associated protein FlgL
VARTLIAARTREEEESSIDPEFIRSEIESIQMALRNASDIRTKVGTIRNSADAIEKTMSAFEEKLETHLGNISKAIP